MKIHDWNGSRKLEDNQKLTPTLKVQNPLTFKAVKVSSRPTGERVIASSPICVYFSK